VDSQPQKLFLKHILRKVFLEDWVMKLVALAITLALWFGVTGLSTPTTQRLTAVPLNLRYSNNIEVTNSPIQEVDLVVTGDKRKLAEINKSGLVVSMDISDVMPGDRVINLSPENVAVSLPTGVRLDGINPARIAVRIEAVEEREVEVRPVTTGDIPPGYELYSETASPAKVLVRGPASFIRSLDAVETERIDLSHRDSDFTVRQVPINVANPKASLLRETVVDVTFRIGEKRVEKIYSVPVGDGRRAIVTLYGAQSLFDKLKPEDIRIELTRNDNGDTSPRAFLPPSLDSSVEIRSVKLRG
jgi:YbbR domain-containing protein